MSRPTKWHLASLYLMGLLTAMLTNIFSILAPNAHWFAYPIGFAFGAIAAHFCWEWGVGS